MKGTYEDVNIAYPLVLELQRIFIFFNLSFYTQFKTNRNTNYFCNGGRMLSLHTYAHVSVYQILTTQQGESQHVQLPTSAHVSATSTPRVPGSTHTGNAVVPGVLSFSRPHFKASATAKSGPVVTAGSSCREYLVLSYLRKFSMFHLKKQKSMSLSTTFILLQQQRAVQ